MYTNVHSTCIPNNPNWKQPRCPPVGGWLNKLWCLHTTEYHSAINMRNKLLTHQQLWWISWELHSKKNTNPEGYTPYDSLGNILEWQNDRNGEQINGWESFRGMGDGAKVSVAMKGRHEGSVGDGMFRLLTVLVLISRTDSRSVSPYSWGKPGREHWEPPCIISYNCMWIYNHLNIFYKINFYKYQEGGKFVTF